MGIDVGPRSTFTAGAPPVPDEDPDDVLDALDALEALEAPPDPTVSPAPPQPYAEIKSAPRRGMSRRDPMANASWWGGSMGLVLLAEPACGVP